MQNALLLRVQSSEACLTLQKGHLTKLAIITISISDVQSGLSNVAICLINVAQGQLQ